MTRLCWISAGAFLFLVATLSVSGVAQESEEITLDEVISKSAAAMGYGTDYQDLKSLRFQLRSVGEDDVTTWEIIRPNRVRKEWDQGVVLVSDGERAAFLAGPGDEEGKLQGPHLEPEDYWHHFEMDIALYIPAYFDYPAQYSGMTDVDGHRAHRISVQLPMGRTAIYLVDSESFLPVSITLPSWKFEVVPGDWVEVDGIKVFRAET